MSNNPLREVKGTPTAPTPTATEAEVMAAIQRRLDGLDAASVVNGRRLQEIEDSVRVVDKLQDDVRFLLDTHDIAQKQAAKGKKPNRVLSATWYSNNRYVRYGTRTVVVAAAGAALYYGGRAGARRYKAWRASKSALDMTSAGADFAQ